MTQPQFSPAIINAMMDEIADGYTLNTVCSGCDGRPTIGQFLLLIEKDHDVMARFADALTVSTWVIGGQIRVLETETTPENAAAHKVRFEMLRYALKSKDRLIQKIYKSLSDDT